MALQGVEDNVPVATLISPSPELISRFAEAPSVQERNVSFAELQVWIRAQLGERGYGEYLLRLDREVERWLLEGESLNFGPGAVPQWIR